MLFFFLYCFQNIGVHLAAVDECNEHVLSVWDWKKEKKLSDTKVWCQFVFFNPSFNPYYDWHKLNP